MQVLHDPQHQNACGILQLNLTLLATVRQNVIDRTVFIIEIHITSSC